MTLSHAPLHDLRRVRRGPVASLSTIGGEPKKIRAIRRAPESASGLSRDLGSMHSSRAAGTEESKPGDRASSGPLTGRLLSGRWRVGKLLGRGGMSTVYAATHRNGKTCALKVLHPELAASATSRRRFLREGYIANKVAHDGVVSVLDDDVTQDGTVFLVMDLLEGTTLEDHCRASGGRLPPGDVLVIADAVLDVLIAAHAKGVVHRDLKPSNVFLLSRGTLKLLDFGIASLR